MQMSSNEGSFPQDQTMSSPWSGQKSEVSKSGSFDGALARLYESILHGIHLNVDLDISCNVIKIPMFDIVLTSSHPTLVSRPKMAPKWFELRICDDSRVMNNQNGRYLIEIDEEWGVV
jgi:hypothetical protein